MKKLFFILPMVFMVACGSSQTLTSGKTLHYNFTQFGFSKEIDLKQVILSGDDLLTGYKFATEMQADPEARYVFNFYNGILVHAVQLGSVVEKSFQSIDGPGRDSGTIMYFEFDRVLDASTYTYLKRVFWGKKMTPSSSNSPEFFMSSNTLIVWCLPMQSEIKERSQKKLFELLNQKQQSQKGS
ncbi:hypothetical protein JNL27_02090 [bacterium]|nr:hypothetical protein [bacterium]